MPSESEVSMPSEESMPSEVEEPTPSVEPVMIPVKAKILKDTNGNVIGKLV